MKIAFIKLTSQYICTILLTICSTVVMAEMDMDVPVGWAVVPSSVGRPPIDALSAEDKSFYAQVNEISGVVVPSDPIGGVENTIGGGNGKVVEVTGDEIRTHAMSKEPLVIMASGSCGSFQVASHKTIIGVGEGLTVNGQVTVDGVKNVILRNLRVSGSPVDAISVAWGSNHIWIDHCDVSSCADGLIDMKRGVDKITISWVRTSKHHKTMLINHGQQREEDNDRLGITLHHMFWDGSNTRNPRVGYGQVHILNCYYNGNGYGIHTYWNTRVRIERNYFNNVGDAISDHKGGSQGSWPGPGYVVLIDNYTNKPGSIQKKTTTDPNRIFHVEKYYMYDWIVTKDVMQVPDVVQKGVGTGAAWGKIGAIPTPGQGCVSVSIDPILQWTKVGSKATNEVYFGTDNPPPKAATVEGYKYKPGKLKDQTVYFWKINDGKVWTFRTDAKVTSFDSKRPRIVKNVVSKKPATVVKTGIPGKSSHFIGVKGGKNQNNVYLMNGKEVIKGAKTPAKVKKEVTK